ncbi:MAG: phosphoribosylglycinamide formyltransferase [Firmicutes bacterium HGW-Firmicutes-11]|nr:MAG: phosphoribosylglycinamide formyltransferase [Firmicutes bacterium HGW-Firmicutes-11]
MLKIAVLVSGGGTNLQALIDAERRGELRSGKLSLVVSSRSDVAALSRGSSHGIPCAVVERTTYNDTNQFDQTILDILRKNDIDVVVLAGFLSVLGPAVVQAYESRMINVHPSLLPSFCGPGLYGIKVHEAALLRGVKITGATVHLVNEIPDGGKILLQKAVTVEPEDTPESLQRRVMEEAEWVLLPLALEELCATLSVAKESGDASNRS